MTARINKVAQQLDQLEADAMLVTNEINVGYLSGFTGDSSYLLIQPQRTTILSDGRYQTQIAQECSDICLDVRACQTAILVQPVRQSIAGHDYSDIAQGITVTLSIGLTDRLDVPDHEKMVTDADRRLYRAKREGRNRVVA